MKESDVTVKVFMDKNSHMEVLWSSVYLKTSDNGRLRGTDLWPKLQQERPGKVWPFVSTQITTGVELCIGVLTVYNIEMDVVLLTSTGMMQQF